jgi:dihydrofolate reductase
LRGAVSAANGAEGQAFCPIFESTEWSREDVSNYDFTILEVAMTRKRKIIVSLATSADGFIARPDGSVDWLDRPVPKGSYGMGAFYKSIDTILWGRKTYDMALRFQEKGVAGSAFDTSVKNYVFTHTPPPSAAPKGVEFVSEPVKAFAARLRAKKGKDIWMMGGGGVIASFLDDGEIDEFILSVVPVMIGEGIPLLTPRHRTVPLKLIASTKFADGVVKLHYSVCK